MNLPQLTTIAGNNPPTKPKPPEIYPKSQELLEIARQTNQKHAATIRNKITKPARNSPQKQGKMQLKLAKSPGNGHHLVTQ